MSAPERVAIIGTRDPSRAQLEAVRALVSRLPRGTVVVTGCAYGIDREARAAAGLYGLPCVVHKADWGQYGDQAGPIRNTRIVADCDRVIAFPKGKSAGTRDTIRKAKAAGKPVQVVE